MEEQTKTLSDIEIAEEAANTLTHGLGLVLSIIGLFWLIFTAQQTEDLWKIGSVSIFGSSLVLLYGTSTLYHGFQVTHIKQFFRVADHCAIYTLIAGSYTPFAVVILSGFWSSFLLIAIWSMAGLGIIFKIFFKHRWNVLSTIFYLLMGWLVVFAMGPLTEALSTNGIYLLIAGGLSYTLGSFIYLLERPVFHHAIWHLFVLGGSTCHFFSVLFYVL